MVLAAGRGERMAPLTDALPKPLLPIANRPVMGYVLEHLARHGFTQVIANLHHRAQDIVEAFGDGSEYGVSLSYAYEEKLWGIAGGVRRCRDFFGDETFLVIGADDLTDMDLSALLAEHRRVGALASIGLVEVEETSQFGIVVTDEEGRIRRFLEKPKEPPPTRTANTQIYLFEPGIFEFIPAGRVYDFGFDAFPALVAAGAPFYGFALRGYWRDIGSIADYLAAQRDVMEKRMAGLPAGEEVGPGVWREGECELGEGARLVPPVALGRGCRLGAGAVVMGGTAVGREAEVASGVLLEKVVVLAGARVGAGVELRGAVVAREGVFRG